METFTRFRALIKLEHITLQERKHLPRALVTPLKSHKQNSNIWKEPCRLTAFLKTCWAINLQSQKELDSASHDKPVYLRNRIENRVSKQQYQANFPVEDYMCDEQLKELDGYLMAVFDGHGGSELAEFSSMNIAGYFENALRNIRAEVNKSSGVVERALLEAYSRLESESLEQVRSRIKNGNRKAKKLGTCALTVIVADNTVYVANAGDSKGILIYEQEQNQNCVNLNHKFNASSEYQQQRLRKEFPHEDVLQKHPHNPAALYVKGRLQCTRSIGDFYLKLAQFNDGPKIQPFNGPYVTSEPDIKKFELDASSRYLVIASDGLWDEITKYQVTKLILECTETNKAQILIDKCLQQIAMRNEGTVEQVKELKDSVKRNYHDDISVMVVDLQGQYSPPPQP